MTFDDEEDEKDQLVSSFRKSKMIQNNSGNASPNKNKTSQPLSVEKQQTQSDHGHDHHHHDHHHHHHHKPKGLAKFTFENSRELQCEES